MAVWAAGVTRQDGATSVESVDVLEATIEVEQVEPPPAEPSATEEATPASAGPPSPVAGNASLRATVASHAPTAGSVEAPSGPVEPPAPDGTWTFNPSTTGGPSAPGGLSNDALSSAMRSGVGAIAAEDAKKRAASARHYLFTPEELDHGVVPGGQLVSLTRDLVRRSLTPDNGRALLQFDIDGKGAVSSVRVLDVSSGRPEWDQVASEIAAASHATTVQVPGGANGLTITMEVTSQMKTVTGAAATGRSTLGKVWGAINDPLGAATDATTHPQRVVASRIVDVRAF